METYNYLWDGSEPGWVILRHTEDRVSLTVVFGNDGASVKDIMALRKVVPTLAQMSASEALHDLRGIKSFGLGEFDSVEWPALDKKCRELGLTPQKTGCQHTHDLLVNEKTGQTLIIEDATLAKQVIDEAIKRGLAIRYSTT